MKEVDVLEKIKELEDLEGAFIWDRNFTRLRACRRLKRYLRLKYNTVETHLINVKGYYSRIFFDNQTEWKFADVKYGAGIIYFRGTLLELEKYESWLVKNEGKTGIKMI